MGRVALDATLAQPFCGQTAVFSEPEKWWRHHCYGACKNSLHVIRQQPPTPRREEKILFDSFFLVCSLQKFFSLDYTRTKNQSSSFNQRFFFSLRTSITNQHTEERNHTNFIIFPLLALVTKLLLLLLRASSARYSHTPNFFLLFSTSSSRDIQQEERKNLAMTNLFCSGRTLTHTCTHTLRVA